MIPLPYGGGNRYRLDRSDYLKAFMGFVLLIGSVLLFAFEVRHFNNTFEVRQLVIRALPAGALLGSIFGYRLMSAGTELNEKVTFFIMPLVLSIAFMPTFASLSNRLFASTKPNMEKVELVKVEAMKSSRFGNFEWTPAPADAFYIFFIRQNQLERIKMKRNIFVGASKGDRVELPVYKGLWGFDFVQLK